MASEDSSNPLVVEKSEVVLVTPSKPRPDVSLSLSTIDNDPFLERIQKTICVYAPKPYLEDQAKDDPVSLLQCALSHALVYYYPLAGKLQRKSNDNKLELNYKAGDGVPFIRATSACTLSSINYLDSARDTVTAYQLVPCYDPLKGCKGYDPLAFQVTKFACGGITIGMAHSHSVFDGVGVAQFFRAMIELASGKTHPTIIPVWDRDRLTFNGKLGDVVDFPKGGSSVAISPYKMSDEMVREIFNVTSKDITKLKKSISEKELIRDEKEKVVVTTFEILAAFVWRARCRALNMNPDATAVLAIPIGIRSIVEPPLPEGYYGNALVSGFVRLTAKELNGSSLSHLVRLIKDVKKAALDKNYLLRQLKEVERKLEGSASAALEDMDIGTLVISDWRQIGLHYDGWGGLVNIIPLIPVTVPLFWVLLPASKAVPEMSGGVRLLVTLPKDAMAKFKQEMNAFY